MKNFAKKKAFAAFLGLFLWVFLAAPASAVTVYNTGDGNAAWGGDAQIPISNISSPPWAPNGTTGAGAIWVNRVNSGFQGGGPALGTLTTYTLTLPDVVWLHMRVLADDGSRVELSLNGGAFATLVNSSGAPQGVNCSSIVPSCPSNMVWDSGVIGVANADVVVKVTTSQDVANTPMAVQATVLAEHAVPEPGTVGTALAGLLFVGVGMYRRRRV